MAAIDEELKVVKNYIVEMGFMVERAIENAIASLLNRDNEAAKEVIKKDNEINILDNEIEEECVKLIALHSPVAKDVRFITTAMKIATDLERIGDLAQDIAERAIELNEEPPLKPYIDIPRMAEGARLMLNDSLDAFVKKDAELANKVIDSDDFIDNLHQQIFRELITYMMEDSRNITRAVRITYVSKYLERIADHTTNIAEMVIFMVEGKVVRHLKN